MLASDIVRRVTLIAAVALLASACIDDTAGDESPHGEEEGPGETDAPECEEGECEEGECLEGGCETPEDTEVGDETGDTDTELTCEAGGRWDKQPAMDGGLASPTGRAQVGMYDFLPLQAEGKDIDLLFHSCLTPEECNEEGTCETQKPMEFEALIAFEWQVLSATDAGGQNVPAGELVSVGCEEGGNAGERAMYRPPYLEPGSTRDVSFQLTTTDVDPIKPQDDPVLKQFVLRLSRNGSRTRYDVEVVTPAPFAAPVAPAPAGAVECPCMPQDPRWEEGDEIAEPAITAAATELGSREIVRLAAASSDMDLLQLGCATENETCPPGGTSEEVSEILSYEWSAPSGSFVGGRRGPVVFWQAPTQRNRQRTIEIEVEVDDDDGHHDDAKRTKKVEITVYPVGLDLEDLPAAWRPQADNDAQVSAKLQTFDGAWNDAPAHLCRGITYELDDISEMPGTCTNGDNPAPNEREDKPDYRFHPSDIGDDGEVVGNGSPAGYHDEARSRRAENTLTLPVRSEDWGGWANLTAETHESSDEGVGNNVNEGITLPLDESGGNRNAIADGLAAWDLAGAQPNVDTDAAPVGDGTAGDGYSVYEEYRGFLALNAARAVVHVSTQPGSKDLFIRNDDQLPLATFIAATGLTVHQIDSTMHTGSGPIRINYNRPPTTALRRQLTMNAWQHGLKIQDTGITGPGGARRLGTVDPDRPNKPGDVRRIGVDVNRIRALYAVGDFANQAAFNAWVAAKIEQVVAHELSHGCNVFHHGDAVPTANGAVVAQGLTSGDTTCVMRYDNVGRTYVDGAGQTQRLPLPETPGNVLCTAATGTGINAAGAGAGDADGNAGGAQPQRGNCAGQVRVRDR